MMVEKEKALEIALGQIEKQFGKGAIMKLGDAGARVPVATISTGCLPLDYALASTGFAGPDGGTEAAPVGTVFLALASPDGTKVKRVQLHGERARLRELACLHAFDLLRRTLVR